MAAGDIIIVNENSFGVKANIYDGTDDYTLHDAQAVARVAAGDTVGTFTAKVYLDNLTDTMTVLSAGDNNVVEYLAVTVAAGKLQCKVQQGGATQSLVTQTTGTMEAKKWHDIGVVNGPVIKKLYVDGEVVAQTNTTTTDPDAWYDIITGGDKFAIGVLEMNATHTNDYTGAIGQVKYWSTDLTDDQMRVEAKSGLSHSAAEQTLLDAELQFNVTYENDGITDSGLGADNGTLTGNAHYGGYVSDYSLVMEANVTGHAAEVMNSFIVNDRIQTVIKRGD